MVGLYPCTPHNLGLTALTGALDERDEETISMEEWLKMAEFVLKNNYLEFGNTIKPQIFGTASGTKFYEASGTKFHENTCHRHVFSWTILKPNS